MVISTFHRQHCALVYVASPYHATSAQQSGIRDILRSSVAVEYAELSIGGVIVDDDELVALSRGIHLRKRVGRCCDRRVRLSVKLRIFEAKLVVGVMLCVEQSPQFLVALL